MKNNLMISALVFSLLASFFFSFHCASVITTSENYDSGEQYLFYIFLFCTGFLFIKGIWKNNYDELYVKIIAGIVVAALFSATIFLGLRIGMENGWWDAGRLLYGSDNLWLPVTIILALMSVLLFVFGQSIPLIKKNNQ